MYMYEGSIFVRTKVRKYEGTFVRKYESTKVLPYKTCTRTHTYLKRTNIHNKYNVRVHVRVQYVYAYVYTCKEVMYEKIK